MIASDNVKLEVDAKLHAPLGMPASTFLRRYWQKRPLLIRNAFPGFESPLSANDLAGLACEEFASSRLVIHKPRGDRWELRHGPFAEADFAKLPKSRWTLLVQDCDKLLAEVGALLDSFRFIPDWRIDDVMISYAADGGSVGAHVDQYDVFLLQGIGRRRWQISTDPRAPGGFRPDVELKLLREFTPTHEWVLAPGDMLYLPPGVPHHGVAVGDCMTYSIGMRAPAVAELVVDFADQVAAQLGEEIRYTDADLEVPREPAEITDETIAKVGTLLAQALRTDGAALRDRFARFITRYRSAHQAVPARRPIDAEALRERLARHEALHRSPWSRMAFVRIARGALLYVAGEAYPCSARLAKIMTNAKRYDAAALNAIGAPEWRTLAELHNAGHLVLARD